MALPKLFNRIFWHNNTTPAINEDNLNAMSKAIDDIDNRVIQLGGDVLETVPELQELTDRLETMTENPPYIGTNGNWYIWNTTTGSYEDSGIDASITVAIADITMLAPDATPYVTNTGTNTDPIFHLFIPRGKGISGIAKTGTSGLVDTYTITYSDGYTSTFTVTNGKSAYQYAVEGGYTGTEAQFENALGNFQTYAQTASEGASTATNKASEAANYASSTSTAQSEMAVYLASTSILESQTAELKSATADYLASTSEMTSQNAVYNSNVAVNTANTSEYMTSASEYASTAASQTVQGSIYAANAASLEAVTSEYASAASSEASAASTEASHAASEASDAEAYGAGTRNGYPVSSSDPAYHNNAKYYAGQAGAQTFSGLNDVNINDSTLVDGQVPVYNGSSEEWENKTLSVVKTATLEAGETTVTFTDIPTSRDYVITFYTSVPSLCYVSLDNSVSGQLTIEYEAQENDIEVYCKVEEV